MAFRNLQTVEVLKLLRILFQKPLYNSNLSRTLLEIFNLMLSSRLDFPLCCFNSTWLILGNASFVFKNVVSIHDQWILMLKWEVFFQIPFCSSLSTPLFCAFEISTVTLSKNGTNVNQSLKQRCTQQNISSVTLQFRLQALFLVQYKVVRNWLATISMLVTTYEDNCVWICWLLFGKISREQPVSVLKITWEGRIMLPN